MKLYHFTAADNVPRIKLLGLQPAFDRQDMVAGHPVVWLTETPTTIMTAEQREAYFRTNGRYEDSWLYGGSTQVDRLTVRIPTHDRNLKRYIPWLRAHNFKGRPLVNDFAKTMAADFWIYFGVIEPSVIVEFDKVGELA